jgi:DNA-binding NarL/FixJ family response regulator
LQQVKQPPPPPRLVVPDLPVELQNVILKTLEKVPARRYQSGSALAEALEASMKSATSEATITEPTPGASAVDTLPSDRSNESAPRAPKRTLRVILADDHTLLRKTLANLLETREDFVVVAEAGDGEAALKQTLAILPDVLVLDLNMPMKGGLDILPTIRRDAPSVKVLVLTGREEELYIVRALRAGAHGYVLKSAEEGELIEAIGKVISGQMYLGRGVAEKVVTGLLTGSSGETSLTEEESKLMLYVAAGLENEQIARRMELPMMTVIEMLARVMNKLGAKDRHAAALKALRMGAILIEDLHHLAE